MILPNSSTGAGGVAEGQPEGPALVDSPRRIVVVDVETSGLNPRSHHVLELAAVVLGTGESLYLCPFLPPRWRKSADPDALVINGFDDRLAGGEESLEETHATLDRLAVLLSGATFAGCNPAFDALFVTSMYRRFGLSAPRWHHRLLDVSAFTAGRLGLGADLPGLNRVCDLLGVENTAPHTALGDATATAECVRQLIGGAS